MHTLLELCFPQLYGKKYPLVRTLPCITHVNQAPHISNDTFKKAARAVNAMLLLPLSKMMAYAANELTLARRFLQTTSRGSSHGRNSTFHILSVCINLSSRTLSLR